MIECSEEHLRRYNEEYFGCMSLIAPYHLCNKKKQMPYNIRCISYLVLCVENTKITLL